MLADPNLRNAYQAEVAQRARTSRLMSVEEDMTVGHQAAVDTSAEEAAETFEGAAAAAIGIKTVVQGATKPFMTEQLRAA